MKKIDIFIKAGFLSFLFTNIDCTTLQKAPQSDHFNGKYFYDNEKHHTFSDEIKWFWQMETVKWPSWIDDPQQPPPPEKVKNGDIRVTYINHATVLIQMEELNILTDPIWSFRAGPVKWLGTKRVRAPGIEMKDLPKIDFILISHDHYDHLDINTLKELSKLPKPVILAGLGIKKILEAKNFNNVIELDWWQEYIHQQSKMKFTFVPARHSSGRGLFDGNKTLWGGFVIEGAAGAVYFAGDTAYGKFLKDIKERFKEFRLAILPIGNYEKRWIMEMEHMNPDDAVRVHKLLSVKQSAGMHFGTFLEHPEQTIDAHNKDLQEALKKNNISESEFWVLKFGEGRYVEQ